MTKLMIGISIFAILGILAVAGLELLLRRWSHRPLFSLARQPSNSRNHSNLGRGSWLLPMHVAAMRDKNFSQQHWHEMREWGDYKQSLKSELNTKQLSRFEVKRLLYSADYQRSEFTVRGGERGTTNQPTTPHRKILCFGGSTTFSMEVPDHATWCSVLQRLVESNSVDLHYLVRNQGIPGAIGIERIQYMESAHDLNPGDVVIFLIGDNDSGWTQLQDRWREFNPEDLNSLAQHTFSPLLRKVLRLSSISELASWVYAEVSPRYLKHFAINIANETINAANEAITFARVRGARGLFVLQPNIFTLRNPDSWDRKIMAGTARDLSVLLEAAYGRYCEWIATCDFAVDATNLFDNESPSPYMGDWAHYNTRGNQIIGEYVYKELKSRGWLSETTSV